MADTPAATATASAPLSTSASGSGTALSHASPLMMNPELPSSPSFDVEEMLAGSPSEAQSTETNLDAETEDETASEETETSATDEETGSSEETSGEETEETAPDAEESDAAPEGLKPKAIKRFNKLLAQRDEAKAAEREAKEALAALQSQFEQRQDDPTPVNIDSNPLARFTNEEQLDAYKKTLKNIQSWCRRNPQGGIPPAHLTGGQEAEFTSDAVVSNLEWAENMLEALPARRDFIADFRAQRAAARAAHPNLFVAGTAENKTAQTLLPKLLNFASQADQDALLAKLVKAELMEQEERDGVARYTRVELKKSANPAKSASPKPAAKPALSGNPVPPVRNTASKSASASAWEKANAPLGSVDVEELLEA